MAFPTFQSVQTVTGNSSVVITKPVSLAVGDILIAWVVNQRTAGSATIDTPTGWTLITTDASSQGAAACFGKYADSADVSASTFTFTSNADRMVGEVIRITTDNPSSLFESSVHAASSSTAGFTPATANGLYLILVAYEGTTSRTVSTYAVTTTNPTWTEANDTSISDGVGARGVSMAYAQRGVLTATGTISAVVSGATDATFIAAIDIVPALPTPLAMNATLNRAQTINIVNTALAIVSTIVSPTVTDVVATWNNVQKGASSIWTNITKT